MNRRAPKPPGKVWAVLNFVPRSSWLSVLPIGYMLLAWSNWLIAVVGAYLGTFAAACYAGFVLTSMVLLIKWMHNAMIWSERQAVENVNLRKQNAMLDELNRRGAYRIPNQETEEYEIFRGLVKALTDANIGLGERQVWTGATHLYYMGYRLQLVPEPELPKLEPSQLIKGELV